MARTGWQGLGELARDLMRVLFVYALLLQALVPLAVARAEARDTAGLHQAVLCSAMTGAGETLPGKAPARVARDCVSCCMMSVAGILPVPGSIIDPPRFALLLAPAAPTPPVLSVRPGGPPPQRAPPGGIV